LRLPLQARSNPMKHWKRRLADPRRRGSGWLGAQYWMQPGVDSPAAVKAAPVVSVQQQWSASSSSGQRPSPAAVVSVQAALTGAVRSEGF